MPDNAERGPDHPAPDPRPQYRRYPGGGEFPPGRHAPGGYHLPEDEAEPAPPTEPALPGETPPEPETPAGGAEQEPAPVAAERFRRAEPARRKAIPAVRGTRHWRLWISTALFVMFTGSWADYLAPSTRALWHLAFWGLLGAAALVSVYRERRNGWDPSPRWHWPAAAVAGTIATEVLVATVGSTAVTAGSAVVLALGVFLVLMFG
ncbi:hypothetical protein [Streptomonospora arabica]|uniref:Uncharacterized protein n=1 Tax=Streptomonospora arabica TaxID=412417 RepID=A0ABV9SHL9_9ACTN